MVQLQLKRDETPDGGKTCPSCGQSMTRDAVICLQCGYDLRTGRRLSPGEAPRKKLPLIVAGAAVAIIAVVAVFFLTMKSSEPISKPSLPPRAMAPEPEVMKEATDQTTQQISTASAPEASAPVVSETTSALVESVVTQTNDTNTEEATNEPPSVDYDAMEKEQRDILQAQLDKQYPMFAIGDEIALRLTNGIVKRGLYQSIEGKTVKLSISSNIIVDVDIEMLDRASRVRCDSAFRHDFIDQQVGLKLERIIAQ